MGFTVTTLARYFRVRVVASLYEEVADDESEGVLAYDILQAGLMNPFDLPSKDKYKAIALTVPKGTALSVAFPPPPPHLSIHQTSTHPPPLHTHTNPHGNSRCRQASLYIHSVTRQSL